MSAEKKFTENTIRRAEGTLAAYTGRRKSWDPGVLRCAAINCLSGGWYDKFEGSPHDSNDYSNFRTAWLDIQHRHGITRKART